MAELLVIQHILPAHFQGANKPESLRGGCTKPHLMWAGHRQIIGIPEALAFSYFALFQNEFNSKVSGV